MANPGQAVALKGKRRQAKTDRLDARWLAMLLAKQMLPTSWIPPEEIQRLRDLTRLRLALSQDRTRWAQRLHAFLGHEGWPCSRSRLLTAKGRLWVASLALDPHAKAQSERLLRLIAALEQEITEPDSCAGSRAATVACAPCRRSGVWGRSSPATCSPRSATLAASGVPASSSVPPGSTQS